MNKLRTIYNADIPGVGSLAFSEVSDAYAEKTAKAFETFEYEPFVIEQLKTLDYDIFIDVGAAFGYFSLIAASLGKKVIAVEPHPVRFGYLWWNTNVIPNIMIAPSAIAEKDLDNAFVTNDIGGLVGKKIGTRVKNTYELPQETLEYLYLSCIEKDSERVLIKVDVEGYEEEVLLSFAAHLWQPNITWIIEIHPEFCSDNSIIGLLPNHTPTILHKRPTDVGTRTYLFTPIV